MSSVSGDRFVPLYSLEQLRQIHRLPIVLVAPFQAPAERSDRGQPGPGVGGVIANLLRRNLLYTRQVSTPGPEDSGRLDRGEVRFPDEGPQIECEGESPYAAIVHGKITLLSPKEMGLRVWINQAPFSPERRRTVKLKFTPETCAELCVTLSERVSAGLGLSLDEPILGRCRQGLPTSWRQLCTAAAGWETNDGRWLAKRVEAGAVHPDAAAVLSDDNCEAATALRALTHAAGQEPGNAMLRFNQFCRFWDGRPPGRRQAEAILRPGLAACPGHGKSQMCMAHVIDQIPGNIDYLLAHSEAGYRLLPDNSFAAANYSGYLQHFAPHDPRIAEAFQSCIQHDPYNMNGYALAGVHFYNQGDFDVALAFAKEWKRLATPPLNPWTLYCLTQDPQKAEGLRKGTYDPLVEADQFVAACMQALGKK